MQKLKTNRLIVLIAIVALGLVGFITLSSPPGTGKNEIEYTVLKGSSSSSIANDLKKHNVISNASFFNLYLRFTGRATSIQVGKYKLHNGMWLNELANVLTTGKVTLNSITIPEGWNHRQIGDHFTENGLVKNRAEFIRISQNKATLKKYNILDTSTEGYLYPETYLIPDGYSGLELHNLMLAKFFKILERLSYKKWNPQELRKRIILASIVEREARHPQERPIIARVFLNRLEKGMRLESCATVQYLFEKSKPKLYLSDLAIPSPYNTYKNYGLPPSPIANPGKAALEAAFLPKNNDFLYFVVKPDGTHHFSNNYKEHLRAKKHYIDSDIVRED